MPCVFGYGSLMNPQSAGATLGRLPARSELRVARLQGWMRRWQIAAPVLLDGTLVSAVFLDIVAAPDRWLNGILLPVSEEELALLDTREFCYDRVDVTAAIQGAPAGEVVYTYVGRPPHNAPPAGSIVMDHYEEIVNQALDLWGAEFTREYIQTTHGHDFPRRGGSYRWPAHSDEEAAK